MTPPLARSGQLFGAELRIVDKNVRSVSKFQQAPIELWIARLIVGRVDNSTGGGLKPESKAALGVVQPARCHACAGNLELIPASDLGKFSGRGHGTEIHREIGE